MRNLSIILLKTSAIYPSPFISQSVRLSLSEVYASKFFFSFVFSPHSASIARSRFTDFLHTSLLLSASYSGYYSSRPSQPASGDVTITDAVFQNCCSSTDGGAIYQTGGALTMARSMFINCYVTGSVFGGGFEATGTSASVSYCCGYGCYTNNAGQFLRIVLPDASSTESIFVNFTTAILCAPSSITSSYESMIIADGYDYFFNCNSSHNYVSAQRSAFAQGTNMNATMMFCTAAYDHGTTCARLRSSYQDVENCNFFNNTGHEGGAMLEMLGALFIKDCVFLSNPDNIFGGAGSASVYNCVFSNAGPLFTNATLYSCSTGVIRYCTSPMSEINTYLCNHTYIRTKVFSQGAPQLMNAFVQIRSYLIYQLCVN